MNYSTIQVTWNVTRLAWILHTGTEMLLTDVSKYMVTFLNINSTKSVTILQLREAVKLKQKYSISEKLDIYPPLFYRLHTA